MDNKNAYTANREKGFTSFTLSLSLSFRITVGSSFSATLCNSFMCVACIGGSCSHLTDYNQLQPNATHCNPLCYSRPFIHLATQPPPQFKEKYAEQQNWCERKKEEMEKEKEGGGGRGKRIENNRNSRKDPGGGGGVCS